MKKLVLFCRKGDLQGNVDRTAKRSLLGPLSADALIDKLVSLIWS